MKVCDICWTEFIQILVDHMIRISMKTNTSLHSLKSSQGIAPLLPSNQSSWCMNLLNSISTELRRRWTKELNRSYQTMKENMSVLK